MMESIGDRILKLRKNLNLTQKHVADVVGITEVSLSRYENNAREPKAEIIAKLAKVLNTTTDYLIDGVNPPFADTIMADSAKEAIADDIIELLLSKGVITEGERLTERKRQWLLGVINKAIEISQL